MIKHRFGICLVVAMLAGCATISERLPFISASSALSLVTEMNELESNEQRNLLAASVLDQYERNPNAENTLRLALLRSLPGHHLSDDSEALILLESMEEKSLTNSQRHIREWLSPNLKYRLALRESNEELRQEMQAVRNALARAREKIEILTRIEETMGPDR